MKAKKSKEYNLTDYFAEVVASWGTVVDERWWVEEYLPAHTDDDDRDWPLTVKERSKYFDSEQAAKDFLNEVEPRDKYHKLRIRHEKCYERLERHWH